MSTERVMPNWRAPLLTKGVGREDLVVDRGVSEIALSIHHMSVGKEGLGMR